MKLFRRKSAKDQRGQSTIEFALTIVLFISFILFFYQLSHIFALGSYVQYATFMSARALESAGKNPQDQSDRAEKTFQSMMKRNSKERFKYAVTGAGGGNLAGLSVGPGPQYDPQNRAYSWMEGVRYTFRGKLFLMPLFGRETDQGAGMQLTSESWLGRETTYDECVDAITQMGGFSDNGC